MTTRSHFVMVSTSPLGLQGGTRTGDAKTGDLLVSYRGYVLLRETASRYWLMQAGQASNVYSVAKSQILYVQY